MAADNKAKILREAEKYVLQGKIAQAITEYQKIIKSDPNDVLTLNTIGDLYLRQGKVAEANKNFTQVAESYTRNSFNLKAIAVYKKIIGGDPDNVDVSLALASLFTKQGLNVEARQQFLRAAEIYDKQGKRRESMQAYESVVELDPANSAVQIKLAETYLADGVKDRAHAAFVGAARALRKEGNLAFAVQTYGRAMQLNPVDTEALKGFLEASIKFGDMTPIIDQLKKSLVVLAKDASLHEMLGLAYLHAKDLENAPKSLETAISLDDSRYESFFSLSKAFVEIGDYDRAAQCLDPIVPSIIVRHESDRLVEAYNLILKADTKHVLSLTMLANLFLQLQDESRYLDVLDSLVGVYLSRQQPQEALEHLEHILIINPHSEKYLNLHRQAFAEAFPGTPYSPPVVMTAKRGGNLGVPFAPSAPAIPLGAGSEAPADAGLLEIDLLITYGMNEKALGMLRSLETHNPLDSEVRKRLLSLYRENDQLTKAAEESLCLAALCHQAHDADGASKYLSEARKLAPELVGPRFNLAAFAMQHAIHLEEAASAAESQPAKAAVSNIEVDLSGDLSEIFFKDSTEPVASDEVEEIPVEHGVTEAPFAEEMPRKPAPESVQVQLQEVDFYIRLGFYDEARTKLDEIARDFPNNPELPVRYRRLEKASSEQAQTTIALGPGERNPDAPVETTPPDGGDIFEELKIDRAVDRFVESYTSEALAKKGADDSDAPPAGKAEIAEASGERTHAEAEEGTVSLGGGGKVNSIFADLMEEVNAMTSQEIAQGDFETHFNFGIAYREMDLVDDAIQQFQAAVKALDTAKSPKEVVQCCGMLSTCFLGKGMPRSAIRWCQAGLSVKGISSHEAIALKYDMGLAHSLADETDIAVKCFNEILEFDPSYRDVAQRVSELKAKF